MSVELFECVSFDEASMRANQPRVDREKGIIHRVKVLGWESANGRKYLRAGVKPALYEGKRVNAGHVKTLGDRDPRDTYAVLEGVFSEDSGIYADRLRLLNPRGEFEQRLLGSAENAPHLFGLSHSARGKEQPGSGGKIIESVVSVDSVDLVGDPATVSGLYESRGAAVMKVRELIESLEGGRPEYARALKEVAEAGIVSPDSTMPGPAGDAGPKDHELALMAGFKAAVAAIMDDASMDWKVKVQKFREVVKAQEKLMGSEEPADRAAEESRRQENANLKEENARLKSRETLRAAADEAGVKLGKSLLESVRPDITEAEARALVEELKASGAGRGGQSPRSAPPLPPKQAGGNGSAAVTEARAPTDPKDFIAFVKGR